jgi:6-phosphogluconolactonase
LRLIVAADPATAAGIAAQEIGRACRTAVAAHGRALIAVSGGSTPWMMLHVLGNLDLPWNSIHVAQVDERCAPRGDAQRNLTRLEQILVLDGPLHPTHLLPMPTESTDLAAAAAAYQATLETAFGRPLRFDVVHLGLGVDGHTASLVPTDPVLAIGDRDVSFTRPYQGLVRMTLTYPALARAAHRLWLVTGESKASRLAELLKGTGTTPAIAVSREHTTVVADAASAPSPALAGEGWGEGPGPGPGHVLG